MSAHQRTNQKGWPRKSDQPDEGVRQHGARVALQHDQMTYSILNTVRGIDDRAVL